MSTTEKKIKEDVGTEKYQDDVVFHLNELIGSVGDSDLIFYLGESKQVS